MNILHRATSLQARSLGEAEVGTLCDSCHDPVKQVCGLIAEADIILSGAHLPEHELIKIFEGAKASGVQKLLVNHPTYVVNCPDVATREHVSIGAYSLQAESGS